MDESGSLAFKMVFFFVNLKHSQFAKKASTNNPRKKSGNFQSTFRERKQGSLPTDKSIVKPGKWIRF